MNNGGGEAPHVTTQSFSLRRRLQSFRDAARGLRVLSEQHNARIHAVAALAVIAAGVALEVSRVEWLALAFAIGLVLSVEALNTGLELLADATVPERHPLVGKAKDVAAAAVLLSAVTAAAIAALVFGDKLL
jgi:diacylglycerol kinase